MKIKTRMVKRSARLNDDDYYDDEAGYLAIGSACDFGGDEKPRLRSVSSAAHRAMNATRRPVGFGR